ncbi:hypothetical protein CP02DC14_0733B, partial [Chlamydia psittaci 02DC14]
RSCLYN